MYWLLYSQATISLCGVLPLTVKRWAAMAADTTTDDIVASLGRLADESYVLVDFDSEEVFVRTFATHDGVGRSPKTLHAAWRQLPAITSPAIRAAATDALSVLGPPPDDLTPNTLSDTPPATPSSLGINRVSDTPSDTPPDRTGGRARAVSSLRLQSPDSSLPPDQPASETCAAHGDRDKPPTLYRDQLDLARRAAAVCTGDNRSHVNLEASALVTWACEKLDARAVEEAIAWAASLETKPALPRVMASALQGKARTAGVHLGAFNPPRTHR
jgi:hypothetical protein